MLLVPEPVTLLFITAVFLISGFVKGVIGVGLPTISLALLVIAMDLKLAMAILLLPALLTNVWQGLSGGALVEIIKRIWVYIGIAFLFTWVGSDLLSRSDSSILTILLGVLLILYSISSLAAFNIRLTPKWEPITAPTLGAISGIFTGLTGTFVVPGVMYLQALGLPREKFIQAMGITFSIASLALGVGLGGHNLMPEQLVYLSIYALAPAFIGMSIGVLVRKRINDKLFRRIFFVGLFVMGLYIAVHSHL